MNKSDLAEKVAVAHNLPKSVANAIVGTILDSIVDAVQSGEGATFPGFGTFKLQERGERTGFNPKTREQLVIPAAKVPRFVPGATFKAKVN